VHRPGSHCTHGLAVLRFSLLTAVVLQYCSDTLQSIMTSDTIHSDALTPGVLIIHSFISLRMRVRTVKVSNHATADSQGPSSHKLENIQRVSTGESLLATVTTESCVNACPIALAAGS
jgi:hypothetical protein